MATLKLLFSISLNSLFVTVCFLTCLYKSFGSIDSRKHSDHYHEVEVASLFPSTTSCIHSAKVLRGKSSLELVHKHGPCYKYKGNNASIPTPFEILEADRVRAEAINARISNGLFGNNTGSSGERLPVRPGAGNYIVVVGLGNPAKEFTLEVDTGSSLTWTQCQPCESCYRQKEAIFDPSKSKSYTTISCYSHTCKSLALAIGSELSCATSRSKCGYKLTYGDGSFTEGVFAKDSISLTNDEWDNFYFGCGTNNEGIWGPTEAGLLGLGRERISIVSQTAPSYNKVFSYCLPSKSIYKGFLQFGGDPMHSLNYTGMTNSSGSEFYGINFVGITVRNLRLGYAGRILAKANAIIDSGTIITRLPPLAYRELKNTFRREMKRYPLVEPSTILDTCYDFRGFETVYVPHIKLTFGGGAALELGPLRTLYTASKSQVCLAFTPTTGPSDDLVVLGNVQQRQLEIFYDLNHHKIGFGPKSCS